MKRSAEFTLSLIGTILLTIGWAIGNLITSMAGFALITDEGASNFSLYSLGYSIISIPLLVLIWVATFKIKNNSRGWGIFMLVMGILYTLSIYFIPGILLLIAGIMMAAKKTEGKTISA
ncbi:DUF4064 domain-containing protein [Peribacillus kribbensis]|uniref:DUF4064 domain-containing protein n=1 Tax=Peribacillus kribbensis TaxID=356658 RepID=UPI00047DDA8D|nr:DUF4064 domain-containing protein [Peribacillus kribbensis]